MPKPFVKSVFPSSWDQFGESTVQLLLERHDLTKVANTTFGCSYDDMKPDKDHVGMHVVALGDFEHFGLNRNFDGFSKQSCIQYHPTFVSHGHVFEHHINKDPKKALGKIVKSAYNERMGRVELMIHAHREKAAEHLNQYDRDGTVAFSMACNIDHDTCTKCGAKRTHRGDPKACDHLKYAFGKTSEDGTVIGTMNPHPLWFDISFVTRPADRIAYDLKKVAGIVDPYQKWASEVDAMLTLPDRLAILSPEALQRQRIMQKIADFEDRFIAADSGYVKIASVSEAYFNVLKTAGLARPSDADIGELRNYAPESVFASLADAGIVLPPEAFFKYAFGLDYGEQAQHMPDTLAECRTVFRRLTKSAECAAVCLETAYDVQPHHNTAVPRALLQKLAATIAVTGPNVEHRAIFATPVKMTKIAVDKIDPLVFNTARTPRILAEAYASYKTAAVSTILKRCVSTSDTDSVCAVAASQNLG